MNRMKGIFKAELSSAKLGEGMTIQEALRIGEGKLASAGIENAKMEALWLLASHEHVEEQPFNLYLYGDQKCSPAALKQYRKDILKRTGGEPLAYILGFQEFFGLKFAVNREVFIPRRETETVVEQALKFLPKKGDCPLLQKKGDSPLFQVLEIGTGCGNIAISIAVHSSSAKIVATDISSEALKIARKNAILHGVGDTIFFVHSDLFPPLTASPFDLIVSNPPYVKRGELRHLQKEIQMEPQIALDGGKDGLKFIKEIIFQAKSYLAENGVLILELSFDQMERAKDFMEQAGFSEIQAVKDLSGIERVIAAKRRGGDG